MKKALLCAVSVLLAAAVLLPMGSYAKGTIKKCRDATGQWHYGDSAAAACADSKVTVINEHGVTTGVIDAPPTATDAKEQQKEKAEMAQKEEQAKRDKLLLATYPHEGDITYIRDRKIAELQSSIQASLDTLKPLQAALKRLQASAQTEQKEHNAVSDQTRKELQRTQNQIQKHQAAIKRRRNEQAAIRAQADKDLKRYREIVGQAAPEKTSAAGH